MSPGTAASALESRQTLGANTAVGVKACPAASDTYQFAAATTTNTAVGVKACPVASDTYPFAAATTTNTAEELSSKPNQTGLL